MSSSKKVGIVGMVVGIILLASGLLAYAIPLLVTRRAPSLHLTVRHETLSQSGFSWLVGAPLSIVLGLFGTVVLLLSFVVYFDTKHKESRTI